MFRQPEMVYPGAALQLADQSGGNMNHRESLYGNKPVAFLPFFFFFLTHTLAQMRMLKKTKGKRQRHEREVGLSEFGGADFFLPV